METTIAGSAETAMREIRAELARQHLSQRQLAERLDWNQNYLWRRLAGRTPLSLDDVEAIAGQLGVSLLALTYPRGEHA